MTRLALSAEQRLLDRGLHGRHRRPARCGPGSGSRSRSRPRAPERASRVGDAAPGVGVVAEGIEELSKTPTIVIGSPGGTPSSVRLDDRLADRIAVGEERVGHGARDDHDASACRSRGADAVIALARNRGPR